MGEVRRGKDKVTGGGAQVILEDVCRQQTWAPEQRRVSLDDVAGEGQAPVAAPGAVKVRVS
jgi:hypothetical protein